jgi:acyl-CoA thioesterase
MSEQTDYGRKLRELAGGLGEEDARVCFEYLSRLTAPGAGRRDFWSGFVGLNWLQREKGHSRGEVQVTPALLNPYGFLSGGVLFTMVDYGMGAALSGLLAEDERSATIEIKLNFLSAVSSGRVVADTTIVHPGRTIVYMESKVEREDGRLVAVATGSFYRFRIGQT